MDYEAEGRGYDDEGRGYDRDDREGRDRSRSPRPDRRGDDEARARSASPNDRDRLNSRGPPPTSAPADDEEAARNPGTNLFVTGIHPSLTEDEVSRLFEKYGNVEKCNIMRDPHTKDSRGFGFVNMMTAEQADAAKAALQGENIEGRTLSIEKARRARPRTPTPGKYFGPPKRDDFRSRGGRYGDRYGDRRGGYDRGGDYDRGYRGSRYGDRYEDRGYGGRRERDDYGPRAVDRYRDDRYSGRRDEGGRGGGYYGREDRGAPGFGEPAGRPEPREPYSGGGRPYDDRGPKSR